MKQLKTVTLALAVMAVFTISCKKKKEESPTSTPTPTTTYSNLTIQIGLADRVCYSWSANSFSGGIKKAVIRCNGVLLDSLVGLDTTVITGAICNSFDPCANSNLLHLQSKNFKVQNNADNYLDIYDNGTLIATSEIILTSTPWLKAIAQTPYLGTDNYTMPTSCALLCVPIR